MANGEWGWLDCGWNNSCWSNCDDCPYAAIVWDIEEEVFSLIHFWDSDKNILWWNTDALMI